MNRKEQPIDNRTHELTDKEYNQHKQREAEKRKKADSIKHSKWFNKGAY